jgi:uncharacterized protein YhaN
MRSCQQAKCQTFDELSTAGQKARTKRELDSRRRTLETQVVRQSLNAPWDEFITQVIAEIPRADAIPSRMEQISSRVSELNGQRDAWINRRGELTNELQRWTGESISADLAARRQMVIAELEECSRQVVVVSLAKLMLNRAIERYRTKNESPALAAASQIFSKITAGHFEAVKAEIDIKGQPVLVGVRNNSNNVVSHEAMSDGTCDQLYLSLRLAALVQWLDVHEPLPLILDDILLNFDDERASATLRMLGDFAQKTQILFFTHHRHAVALAKAAIPEARFQVLEIPSESD